MTQAKITFVPYSPTLGELSINLKKIETLIKGIILSEKSDIIIFPELATTGYLLESLTYSCSLEIPNDIPDGILALSKNIEIHIGALIKENGNVYNSSIVLYDEKILHVHKKLYLPSYGFFDEPRYFSAGNTLKSYDGKLGKSAILICEDAFHPALAYTLYAKGVQHVFVPSCSPARGIEKNSNNVESYSSWKKRLEVYADSFGQFYYYINRSGSEDGVYFDGNAIFVSPNATSVEFSGSSFYSTTVELSDIESAARLGGPFQDEHWDLNQRLISEAHTER